MGTVVSQKWLAGQVVWLYTSSELPCAGCNADVAEAPTNGFSARQPEMRHLQHLVHMKYYEHNMTCKPHKLQKSIASSPEPSIPSIPRVRIPKWF